MLTEEHSQLLSRQVGVTGQRTSLRQQLLTLEEQYTQARAQVCVCLCVCSCVLVCVCTLSK